MKVLSVATKYKFIARTVLMILSVSLLSTMAGAQTIAEDETGGFTASQSLWLTGESVTNQPISRQPVILYHDPNPPTIRRISPPRVFSRSGIKSASIYINYLAAGATLGSDLCYAWPNNAKTAFDYAASIWESLLNSTMPIEIDACWTELVGIQLGGASSNWVINTSTSTWYQESLANSLAGINVDPGDPDIKIRFNRLFDWYYGTDGSTPSDRVDFASVVLHEIGHGLGFSGSMSMTGTIGSWGWGEVSDPAIYDRFTETGVGTPLLNLGNGTPALGSALTGEDVFFNGTHANAANGGSPPELYAPSSWQPGSSYSHLDYDTFNDTVNGLMVYRISSGESVHNPGPVMLGMLEDMGWVISSTNPPPTLTSITPDSGFNDGIVHITDLSGSDFVNPTVKLTKLGQTDIAGTSVTVGPTNTLTCDFDLSGAAPGTWHVEVTNADLQQATLPNGFTVMAVPAPDVNINKTLIGSDFLPGSFITFTLDINNSGTLTATNVVVTDDLPVEVINPSVASTLAITATGAFSYTWDVEPLHPGESGMIIIYAQVDPALTDNTSFDNTATISDPEDDTPNNNTSSVNVIVGKHMVYLPIIQSNWPPIQTVRFNADEDSTIMQSLPAENFGESVDMWVGYDHNGCHDFDWGGQIARSLVYFDLSSIPAGAVVKGAALYLNHENYCDIGQRTHIVTTFRVNDGWSSSTVTWNNQPSIGEAYGSAAITSGDWGYYPFDVTALVQGWVNGSFLNYGVMLRGPESSGDDSARLGFTALDYIDPAYIPYLEITYGGATQVQPILSNKVTPESSGTGPTIKEVLNAFTSPFDFSASRTSEWTACSSE